MQKSQSSKQLGATRGQSLPLTHLGRLNLQCLGLGVRLGFVGLGSRALVVLVVLLVVLDIGPLR